MKHCIGILLLLALVACDDGSSKQNNNNTNNVNNANNQNLPPPLCQTQPSGEVLFVDASDEAGIGVDGEHLLGNRLGAVDLDGDGYPDLVIHTGDGYTRDAADALDYQRKKRVLRNVEDPQNPGRRMFVEYTADSGYDRIPDTEERGRGASFAVAGDINGDGHLDLLSVVYASTAETAVVDETTVLYGDGAGHFIPQTAVQPWVNPQYYSTTSAALTDYNRDSSLDIFMGYSYKTYGTSPQQDRLFRNSGAGTYGDVTDSAGLTTLPGGEAEGHNHKPSWGVTVCDINGDGWPDLLSSSYGRAWNGLYLGNDGLTFSDVSESSTYRADDLMDYSDNQFYICHCRLNPGPECDEVLPGTQMITCSDDYWYVGSDDQPYRNGGNTFTSLCADFDNDGDMDVYHAEIHHWHIGNSSDSSQLLRNTGETPLRFERPGNDVTGLDRVHEMTDWNEGDITAVTMDFDNDGLLDILVGDSDYPGTKARLFRQKPDHTFEEVAESLDLLAPRAGGVSYLDYDQDGDLDLLIGFSRMRCTTADTDCIFDEPRVRLFRNDGGSGQNRAVFRLRGGGSYGFANTFAIGAQVSVTAGEVTQIREIQSSFGHFGILTPLEAWFGLGSDCDISRVEIRWPNLENTVTVLENVSANYIYYIDEVEGLVQWEPMPVE
ncbi:CRTAC1 family protein [Myxococcota bacterium]|jgi:hypothetical protein|nr:CRTAC1 family protein [Myxococcota bacterium]MBU1411250.1 CRTAC1 family protein [Myxococcota bacterium]MBU1509625.1 CRTAC1 family protein [Myxococcota bacterium]PKN26331.1 MAG: hypothetical protein CVU65_05955 [Deltaproteobacteria bacterium HGW-Deltaproteobacteria-22]